MAASDEAPVLIEDDDDDMADLFSFGSGDVPIETNDSTDDSLLQVLAGEDTTPLESILSEDYDAETQEMLDWLDGNGDKQEEEKKEKEEPEPEAPAVVEPQPEPTVVSLPPDFTSLQEALASSEATSEQIRHLYTPEALTDTLRPEFICRVVAGKTVAQVLESSLADAYQQSTLPDNLPDWIAQLQGADLQKLVWLQQPSKEDPNLVRNFQFLLQIPLPAPVAHALWPTLVADYIPWTTFPKPDRHLYLLANYHWPLLVYHLDRYVGPTWWHSLMEGLCLLRGDLACKDAALTYLQSVAGLEAAQETLLAETDPVVLQERLEELEWPTDVFAWQTATPPCVLETLRRAPDVLVQTMVQEHQLHRLNRARLVAYYRQHAPDKEDKIDHILQTYAGRIALLDRKLQKKYGASPELEAPATVSRSAEGVCVSVQPSQVLPVVGWSPQQPSYRKPQSLKYYLIDARSDDAIEEQGRFPTAVCLSPEALMDPDQIAQNEERLESLRGAVHIVVMGEGFSAIPDLYGQKLTSKLESLMEQDESRTNICALFFLKKGFPFVSTLDGGFAAAHSWLVREGPKHNLSVSTVLVDYNPEASMFGQMETLRNASATEKAQRTMASMLETSLVVMTRRAQQLERMASEMEKGDNRGGIRLSFFQRKKGEAVESATLDGANGEANAENRPVFRNPFAKKESGASPVPESKPAVVEPTDPAPEHPLADGTDNTTKVEETAPIPAPAAAPQNPIAKFLPKPRPDASRPPESKPEGKQGNPLAGLGAAWTNATKRQPETESKPVNNPFKGFGAALNNMQKAATTTENGQKRNPFARFGGVGNARRRSQASENDTAAEESISFSAPADGAKVDRV